jgi:anti-anti-sigma factor
MVQLAPQWTMDVERGPGWLFVRLHGPDSGDAEGSDLAEMLWSLLEQHFALRMVLELDDVPLLRSSLIGHLVRLHKRIATHEGMLRICGLSAQQRDVLRACRIDSCIPQYASRTEAVMGTHWPNKPR